MEVPRLGVELELQLPVYATAATTQDPSLICDLYHRRRQHGILKPLSGPGMEPVSSRILVRLITALRTGTLEAFFFDQREAPAGSLEDMLS